jgi:two-component system sensor histidine kinase/response regulator
MTKILVVEDNEPSRINMLELLEAEGFDVVGAKDGRVGVQLAREHLPDLIVCDIMMPELDGYGVLSALRQDLETATIPFIFLTAKADQAALRQGMVLGADDYLTKPFKRDELLEAISTRLDKHTAVQTRFQKKLNDLRDSVTLALPHELRTPLTSILTGSTLLQEDFDSLERGDIQDLLDIIHAGAQRLQRLVMNYLLYAELEVVASAPQAARVLSRKSVNPQPLVAEVALHKAAQTRRNSDLSLEVAEADVRIAEDHLHKIAEELVDNAFKFSQAGTLVRVAGTGGDQTYVLSFTDHGRGMTAEQVANVGAYMQFERKLHEQQGQGLGLAIAKRLAELYGGGLTIESTPGRQTTVHVTLPV